VPLAPQRLSAGSWLLLLRKDGFEDLRLPVYLEAGPEPKAVHLRADLLPAGTTPAGFVWVAPGRFIRGGDPLAFTPGAREETWHDGFWISRLEVSVADYLEFLNDNETLALVRRSTGRGGERIPRILVFQDPRSPLAAPCWMLGTDRITTDWDPASPVRSISCRDADAYCAWRSVQAKKRGDPWRFRLPTEDEWEKAARGADGRIYVWGNTQAIGFCWSNEKNQWSSDSRTLPPRHLKDESPFGVCDMASSLLEWCLSSARYPFMRAWRGGAMHCRILPSPDREQDASAPHPDSYFRVASRHDGHDWRPSSFDGFRIVTWRVR
jgi:serine/threonine-protein kinase